MYIFFNSCVPISIAWCWLRCCCCCCCVSAVSVLFVLALAFVERALSFQFHSSDCETGAKIKYKHKFRYCYVRPPLSLSHATSLRALSLSVWLAWSAQRQTNGRSLRRSRSAAAEAAAAANGVEGGNSSQCKHRNDVYIAQIPRICHCTWLDRPSPSPALSFAVPSPLLVLLLPLLALLPAHDICLAQLFQQLLLLLAIIINGLCYNYSVGQTQTHTHTHRRAAAQTHAMPRPI